VTSPLQTKPIRTVLKWQIIATVVIAAIAGVSSGLNGVVSAALGGIVNLSAGVGFALVWGLGLGTARSTAIGTSLVAMFRAEAVKILLIVAQLWLVLSMYKDIVMAAFFTAFIVTVIIFSMAIVVRDE
jgi:ATP synthase protein I